MEKYRSTPHPTTDRAIKCNHCGNSASMAIICDGKHVDITEFVGIGTEDWTTEWQILRCTNCFEVTIIQESHSSVSEAPHGVDANGNDIWVRNIFREVLYPFGDFTIPKPHLDMPNAIVKDYEEARQVFSSSPRSSAALLRLAVQKLCKELGGSGKNINDDIQFLVKEGLPSYIQQALDIVRIIGNEAVHPGEIDIDDTPEIARELFDILNEIIEEQISKPKKQAEIDKIYQNLPKNKLEGIKNRDKNNKH